MKLLTPRTTEQERNKSRERERERDADEFRIQNLEKPNLDP